MKIKSLVILTAALCAVSVATAETVTNVALYTQERANTFGGDSGIQSKINTEYGYTKSCYDTWSQTGVYFSLLAKAKTAYTGSGRSDGGKLTDLRNNVNGMLNFRNSKNSDTITLFITLTGCGIADLPGYRSLVECFDKTTWAHEVGHNFGTGHGDGDAGDVSYARGKNFYANSRTYVTIMGESYISGTPCNRFSGKSLLYYSVPTGDSYHDNVRRIKETKAAMAAKK